MFRSILASALLVLSVSAYAAADFVSVSQTRKLECSDGIDQNFSVGPWAVSCGAPDLRYYATHESTIAPGSIDLNCSATCGSSFIMGLWRGELARSSLVADIAVGRTSTYRMQGTPTGDLVTSLVTLRAGTGLIVFRDAFAAEGTIPPGFYKLTIEFAVQGQQGGGLVPPPPLTGAFIVDFDVEAVPVIEACCFADGTCQDMDTDMCLDSGGTPGGTGSTCATLDCGTFCAGDADGDGVAGLSDLAMFITYWNELVIYAADAAAIDLDRDGVIGLGDLAITIANWGEVCP